MRVQIEPNKKLALKQMKHSVEVIRKVIDNFTDDSELFLAPMYVLVSRAMTEVLEDIGEIMDESKGLSGDKVLHVIADTFMKQSSFFSAEIDRLSKQTKQKSHNELLAEKLMIEAGLQ